MTDPTVYPQWRRSRLERVRRAYAVPGARGRLLALARAADPSRRHTPRQGGTYVPFSPRLLAITGCVVLLLAVLAACADATASGDRVDRLSQPALERAARNAVAHGGIRSHRWGDASPWLRRLSYELVERAFRPSARWWALCVVKRESGFNPGAISRTDDHGLPQVNRPSHRWVNYGRITRDPVYAVAVMVRLSDHGASRGPWAMGYGC